MSFTKIFFPCAPIIESGVQSFLNLLFEKRTSTENTGTPGNIEENKSAKIRQKELAKHRGPNTTKVRQNVSKEMAEAHI